MTARSKTPAASAALPQFEPDVFYAVDLARKTVWKGRNLLPAQSLELRGDVCEGVKADIARAVAIVAPATPEP